MEVVVFQLEMAAEVVAMAGAGRELTHLRMPPVRAELLPTAQLVEQRNLGFKSGSCRISRFRWWRCIQ